MKKLLILLFLLFVPSIASSQWLDPDRNWNKDQWEHFAAGTVLDVAVRGPWIAENFRNKSWKRVLLVTAVGVAYESLQLYETSNNGTVGKEGYGFGLLDLGAGILGAVALEYILGTLKK